MRPLSEVYATARAAVFEQARNEGRKGNAKEAHDAGLRAVFEAGQIQSDMKWMAAVDEVKESMALRATEER